MYRSSSGSFKNLGKDKTQALVNYARFLMESGVPTPLTLKLSPISKWMDRYIAEEVPKKAPSTHRDLLRQIENLRAYFGEMMPGTVEPHHVYGYMAQRAGSPGQANREKALLSHLFTKMMEWGAAKINPCRGVKGNPESPRTRAPTPEELAKFIELAQPIVRLYVRFKLATSLRAGDVLSLPPIDTDQEEWVFLTGIQKSERYNAMQKKRVGRKSRYKIDLNLWSIITSLDVLLSGVENREGLFCNRKGNRYTVDGFKCLWATAMARMKKKYPTIEHFREHDIRATVALADPENAQVRLGHKRRTTTDTYLRAFDVTTVPPADIKLR